MDLEEINVEFIIGKALAIAVSLGVVGFLIRAAVQMFATLNDKIAFAVGKGPKWIKNCAILTGLCWLGACIELVVWFWTIA